MEDPQPRVCLARSYRFSGIVHGEAAIWDLTLAVEGVPDAQSGMVVSLPSIDLWLQAAAQDLTQGTALADVLLTVVRQLKASGHVFAQAQMSLDDGLRRRSTAI